MDKQPMALALALVVAVVLAVMGLVAWTRAYGRKAAARRAAYVRTYAFPSELRRRIGEQRPEWTFSQIDRVLEGLREYFLACVAAQGGRRLARQLGMPSKAVDDAWHAFIVMTRDYAAFCERAFGRYLHHTPHAQMEEPVMDAVANTLHQVRQGQRIAPGVAGAAAGAVAVPLLFALDRELGLRDGYHYDEGTIDALEARRKQLLAMQGGGGDAGSADVSGSHCAASDASCGDGGGGSCGGGGGCGGS